MARTLIGTSMVLMLVALITTTSHAVVTITPSAGFDIGYDGNDGDNFNPADPATVPANLATAPGASPFASSQLSGFNHFTAELNDGEYGNARSWISNTGDPNPFAGVVFATPQLISSVAWGRDNGNSVTDPGTGGQLTDRTLGVYTLQRTTIAGASAATAETGNAATGWETIGTLNYVGDDDAVVGGGFTSFFRHSYDVSDGSGALVASAIRIKVPVAGLPGGTAIDEIEAFNQPLTLIETGSHSQSNVVPNNLALASNGATAFAKDGINFPPDPLRHTIPNINDGNYGNSRSWIGATADSFLGVDLGGMFSVDRVAWGRDNGGDESLQIPPAAANRQFTDRSLGEYILQYTTVLSPDAFTSDADWITIGSVTYDGLFPTDPSVRHLWGFTPVRATGFRLLTPNGAAIDEFEVFPAIVPEPATMSLALLGMAGLARRRRQQMTA